MKYNPKYFEAGCYGDGVYGHQHTREACAACLDGIRPTVDNVDVRHTLDNLSHELRQEMTEDASEEIDAVELLDALTDTPDNTAWGWQDGDFGLWLTEEE